MYVKYAVKLSMKDSFVNGSISNDAGGFIYFMQTIQTNMSGSITISNTTFDFLGAYFGGGLLALRCFTCVVKFD